MITRRQRNFLISLLTVSLVLNIAAAGYIGSRLVRDRISLSLTRGLTHEPSPAVEQAYADALQSEGGQMLAALARLKQARKVQHDILTAPIYDTDRHAAAQQMTRQRITELLGVLHGALRKTAEALPDDERRNIPEFRENPFRKPGDRQKEN